VDQNFADATLQLELPECSTLIRIDLPTDNLDVEWAGASGEVLEKEKVVGKTRAIVRGRGAGKLTWRNRSNSFGIQAIEVDNLTRLTVPADDKPLRLTTRLKFSTEDRNSRRDFTIRLPPNARWTPAKNGSLNSNWSLQRLDESESTNEVATKKATSLEGSKAVEQLKLQFANTVNAINEDVVLDWTWTIPNPDNGQLSISAIQIDEVQRHDARLVIVVPASKRFTWIPHPDFELSAQTPSTNNPGEVEYEFWCVQQNATLSSFIGTKETQARWRPDYRIRFARNEIELEGVISFNSDHRSLAGLEIYGGEWRLSALVDDKTGQAIPFESIDLHSIRIPSNSDWIRESPIGDFTSTGAPIVMHFSAVQPFPKGERVSLQLPKVKLPFGQKPEPKRGEGIVVVETEDWQIAYDDVQTPGLIKTSEIPNNLREHLIRTSNSETVSYRFQSVGQEPKWIGKLRRSPQTVSLTTDTHIEVAQDHWKIKTDWSIDILGSPIDRLPIRVPSAWLEIDESTGSSILSDSVAILNGTTRLNARVLSEKDGDWSTLEIEGTQNNWPKSFKLTLSTQQASNFPDLKNSGERSRSLTIPLPKLGLATGMLSYAQSVSLSVGPGIVCEVKQKDLMPLLCTSDDRKIPIEISLAQDEVTFGIMELEGARESAIDLERVWLQTIVNRTERRERCVMRLKSNRATVRIALPPSWNPNDTRILLNGKKAVVQPDSTGNAVWLKLSERDEVNRKPLTVQTTVKDDAVLEFFHWSESNATWRTVVGASIPQIDGFDRPVPFDWQVVTSADDCLFSRSHNVLPERRWSWMNLGWTHSFSNIQKIFEDELQASPQLALPEYSNHYLFKSVADFNASRDQWTKSICLVPRYTLWLPVAFGALILTALWPRIGVLQHPWLMLVVAVSLGILSMWAPDMTIVLLKSAMASLFVIFAVKSLQWGLKQRGYRRSVFAGRVAPTTSRPIPQPAVDESKRGKSRSNLAGDVLISSTTHTMQSVPAPAPTETD
jgi:hypothetical protein